MARFLQPFEGPIYSALRAITGLLFVQHGLQKVFGLFGGRPEQMPPVMLWTSGLLELVGGALIAVGLLTRWSAFLCSGLMAAAYFIAHAPNGFLPILNRGELSILYCWIFLFFAAHGPGTYSLDRTLGRS